MNATGPVAPIKFGTDGWRAVIGQDFTFSNLRRVAQAVATYLKEQHPQPKVVVGYDTRFMGAQFAQAVALHLASQGCKVFLTPGFVSTPMLSLATLQRQCHLGVIITASHNPPEYSGLKLKAHYGGPATPELVAAVEKRIPAEAVAESPLMLEEAQASGTLEYYDAEALYLNHLRQVFPLKELRARLTLGYDAMYGAGQRALAHVWPEAVQLRAEVNPGFGGIGPEPVAAKLTELAETVNAQHLSLGLATDGDADRLAMYDAQGRYIDSHTLLLLLIHYLHRYRGMQGRVVATFSCTRKIEVLCRHYGLPCTITAIGFKYIAAIMQQETVLVGGEESGGIAVLGHIPERDGLYVGLTIAQCMLETGKTLAELVDEVTEITGPYAMARVDAHLTHPQKEAVLTRLKQEPLKALGPYRVNRVETTDGTKYWLEDRSALDFGWLLIRASGTEPVLRLYAEGGTSADAQEILILAQEALGVQGH